MNSSNIDYNDISMLNEYRVNYTKQANISIDKNLEELKMIRQKILSLRNIILQSKQQEDYSS